MSISMVGGKSASWRHHERILQLADRHPDVHVAATGPAAERWQQNYYAAIACSTVNELHSRDCKPRFAGRGGMGSILGSKNLVAIVAQAPDVYRGKLSAAVLAANKEISRGAGSRNYREAHKANGNGGTRRNIAGLHPAGALPEMNFWPQGNEKPVALSRDSMEQDYFIKDGACFKCGLLLERKQGTNLADYVLPARVYEHNPNVQLPHFITPDFWQELRHRVLEAFDKQIVAYGL